MFIILVKRLFAYFKNVLAGKIALYSGEAISDSLSKEIILFLQNNETSYIYMSFLLAQMKELKKTSTPTEPPPILGGRN